MLRLNFCHTKHTYNTITFPFVMNSFRLQMHSIRNMTVCIPQLNTFTVCLLVRSLACFMVSFILFLLHINSNLTHFRRSYFLMSFGFIEKANVRSLLLRVHVTVLPLRHNIYNDKHLWFILLFSVFSFFFRCAHTKMTNEKSFEIWNICLFSTR